MTVQEFFNINPWCQHSYTETKDGVTSYCLIAAINTCYPEIVERDAAANKIMDKLGYVKDEWGYLPIIGWQDRPQRTFEEIKQLAVELNI